MKFTVVDIILAILFTTGTVVLFWALVEEARTRAPFYVILSGVAAMLMIVATFIAAVIH